MAEETKDWLTVQDVVARTGMPLSTVRQYLRDPDNPAHLPNKAYPLRGGKAMTHRIKLEDFETWWAARSS